MLTINVKEIGNQFVKKNRRKICLSRLISVKRIFFFQKKKIQDNAKQRKDQTIVFFYRRVIDIQAVLLKFIYVH